MKRIFAHFCSRYGVLLTLKLTVTRIGKVMLSYHFSPSPVLVCNSLDTFHDGYPAMEPAV